MGYFPFKSWMKFTALGLLILAGTTLTLCINWYQITQQREISSRTLSSLYLKRQLILNMSNAVYSRAGSLSKLVSMTDQFSFDDEYLIFTGYASLFMNSKNLLFEYHISNNKEQQRWDTLFLATNVSSQASHSIIEYLINSQSNKAVEHYLSIYMPSVEKQLNLISKRFRSIIQQEKILLNDINEYEETVDYLVIYIITTFASLGFMTFALLIMFIRLYYKSAQTLSTRLDGLAKLFSQQGLSSEEQIERLLEYGCFLLNMDTGALSKLSQDSSSALLLNYYSKNNDIALGDTTPTDRTFCSAILSGNTETVYLNVPSSDMNTRPLLHDDSEFTSYMACKLHLNNAVFGVLYFSSKTESQDFSTTKKNILKLFSGWICYILANKYSGEELRQSRLDAENANTLKNSFLSNISHELRTPLNAIIGYSDLLIDELADSENETSAHDAQHISKSGNHLLSLINEILDLSYIEAGKFDIQPDYFNFNRIIDDIVASVNTELEKNNNKLEFNKSDTDIILYTDKSRLIQVLITILNIANKFNAKSKIHIGASTIHRSDKDWLEVKITDFGIKMSDDQLNRIFKPFTQADSSFDHVYGGTGLELTISKRICQLMGGDIRVEKDAQSNTVFLVTIPSNVISQNYTEYFKVG